MEEPSRFTAFDNIVLEVGVKIAVEKYLKWTESMKPLKPLISTNQIETCIARYYHPTGLTKRDKMKKYFQNDQKLDQKDIEKRKEKRDTLQESDKLFSGYKESLKKNLWGIGGILGIKDIAE